MTGEAQEAILRAVALLEDAGDLTEGEVFLIDLVRSQVALQNATQTLVDTLRRAVEAERSVRIWQAVSRSVN